MEKEIAVEHLVRGGGAYLHAAVNCRMGAFIVVKSGFDLDIYKNPLKVLPPVETRLQRAARERTKG